MSLPQMIVALLALLLTPGPTNTLMALAGAERGFRAAMPLIGAEVAGYLTSVLPLILFGSAFLDAMPPARVAVSLLAALWVAWLALRMWQLPVAGSTPTVSAGGVYATTVLNPKGLVIGLVLLPASDLWGTALNMTAFLAAVCTVAAGWIALGVAMAGGWGRGGLPASLRRGAALWLGAVALWLAARGAGLVA